MRYYLILLMFSWSFTYAQTYDLRIMAVDHHAFVTPGSYDVKLMFQNLSSTSIQNFKLKWSLDNVLVDSVNVVASSAIQPSGGGTNYYFSYTVAQALDLPLTGERDFKLWIDQVQGVSDINPLNDTVHYLIHVVDYLPEKRVLLEKYSHHTCGPCYGGDLDTEILLGTNSKLSSITIHEGNSDPMSFPDGATLDAYFSTAHPNFVFDRMLYPPSEEYGSLVWAGVSYDLEKRLEMREGLEVHFINKNYNPTTRELSVTLEAEFFANYYEALAFNLYVTEDSVFGYQASAPNPNNYYHMHVARAILGGPFGTDMTGMTVDGNTLQHTFNYILPVNFDENQIHVIGLVQRKDGGLINVVNSTEQRGILDSWLGVTEMDNFDLKVYPNPSSDMIYIDCAEELIDIRIYDLFGKELLHTKEKSVSLKELTAGSYLIRVVSSSGTSLQRIQKH